MLAPWWWWKAGPSDLYLTEYTAVIIFGPLLVIVGIGFFCWLLFTLAVFAMPFFVGLTIGIWALHTGAGVLGGITVGLVAGGVTFGIGQLALAFVLAILAGAIPEALQPLLRQLIYSSLIAALEPITTVRSLSCRHRMNSNLNSNLLPDICGRRCKCQM